MSNYTGVAGTYATVSGQPPIAEDCTDVAGFKPARSFLPATDVNVQIYERTTNSAMLYGTPLTHHGQQLLAFEYGLDAMGFDEAPVGFMVEWAWMPPSMFYVSKDGWRQG